MAKRAARKAQPDTGRTSPGIADPVSLADAVSKTGLSSRTIRRHIKAGRLRAQKKNGRFWLERADVDALSAQTANRTEWTGAPRHAHSGLPTIIERLEQRNEGLLAELVSMTREHTQHRRELQAADDSRARELAELQAADAGRRATVRWVLVLAGAGWLVAVVLALVLVLWFGR